MIGCQKKNSPVPKVFDLPPMGRLYIYLHGSLFFFFLNGKLVGKSISYMDSREG